MSRTLRTLIGGVAAGGLVLALARYAAPSRLPVSPSLETPTATSVARKTDLPSLPLPDARSDLAPTGPVRDALLARVEERLGEYSDRDLLDALERHTVLDRERMEGLRDVRAYLVRLADIALSPPPMEEPALEPIRFGRFLRADGEPRASRDRFPAATRKIFAIFPTPKGLGDHVTVHWIREGEGMPRLLTRSPVQAGRTTGSVWLRPDGPWTPGRYRVAVFSGDETARPLAMGRYEISGP